MSVLLRTRIAFLWNADMVEFAWIVLQIFGIPRGSVIFAEKKLRMYLDMIITIKKVQVIKYWKFIKKIWTNLISENCNY